jgi:hypothetical protein
MQWKTGKILINNSYLFSFSICLYPYTICTIYYIAVQSIITLLLVELSFIWVIITAWLSRGWGAGGNRTKACLTKGRAANS